jgi:hypothetical protein
LARILGFSASKTAYEDIQPWAYVHG